MTKGIGGAHSQLTGERAETKVKDALLDAELFCSKYEHDRGEDLLVELEGYVGQADSGSGPRIGLLQIRGHESETTSTIDEGRVKRRITLQHLQRWAAIPLPVFVVAVELVGSVAQFFARSVDQLVGDVAPQGLGVLEKDTVTVSLPWVSDLPAFLKAEIAEFYSLHAFHLTGLSEDVTARNHYELISSNVPFVPTHAKVWMKNIRVLWKGPWRPAHFWATVNDIADRQRKMDGGRSVPLMATMHVYRSLKDDRDNNAIAHVSWLEDDHPRTDQVRTLLNWPKAVHWSRFRFHGKSSLELLPESFVLEEDDEVFLAKADKIWSRFDAVYTEVITFLTPDLRIPSRRLRRLERVLNKLEDGVVGKLGRPSPQFRVIDGMIGQYNFVLSGVLTWLKGKDDVPEVRRKRWLQQDLELAEGHHRAFYPLVKLLRDG